MYQSAWLLNLCGCPAHKYGTLVRLTDKNTNTHFRDAIFSQALNLSISSNLDGEVDLTDIW